MKTGLFGGAFNPFHNGHLQLMQHYLEALSLDRIFLIPTAIPPHKTAQYLVSAEDRLAMLALVAAQDKRLIVSDMEFHRQGKSYSIDTIHALKKQYPKDDFYLIVGSDQFLYFQEWYKADEILSLVTVCTSARHSGEYETLLAFQKQYENMKNCIISNFEVFDISSSEIRNRVKEGKSIAHLVPPSVENYIKEHGLYVG